MASKVVYSRHARPGMVLRGISHTEIEDAIRVGSKTLQEGRIVSTYRYFSVVYVIQRHRCFVITVKPRW